ncbi:hypothetical protein [Mucilaginibacter antarcticus]|uniref:hypothetical protein n=1 Tax=Mucilaginibacter antarcticus TaxID=1855725 RepID=UPI00363F361D
MPIQPPPIWGQTPLQQQQMALRGQKRQLERQQQAAQRAKQLEFKRQKPNIKPGQ